MAKSNGLGGLLWAKRTESGWEGQGAKAFGAGTMEHIGGAVGDLLLAGVGISSVVLPAMGQVRLEITRRPGQTPATAHAFCWIVDFPLFELDAATGEHMPAHHPFTSPKPGDIAKMDSDDRNVLKSMRADAYDLVLNGSEIGGGSIRIHDRDLQARNFKLLGFTKEEAEAQFGFLLGAFEYGAPPHGGIAFGFDRLNAVMNGASSIRDFIAFPKNNQGRDMMIDAPDGIKLKQLEELGIRVVVD